MLDTHVCSPTSSFFKSFRTREKERKDQRERTKEKKKKRTDKKDLRVNAIFLYVICVRISVPTVGSKAIKPEVRNMVVEMLSSALQTNIQSALRPDRCRVRYPHSCCARGLRMVFMGCSTS